MKRAVRVTVVVGLLWLMAGIPTQAPAQFETGPFAGFGLDAWGSSFSMIYDDPNGPIPAHPQGEMHAGYALATLSDGPSGHGVASEFWPGATGATAAPFIEDSFWDGFDDGSRNGIKAPDGTQVIPGHEPPPHPTGLTPTQWPTAAEVFEPAGPHTQDVPPNAHAHSTDSVVHAKVTAVPLSLPGLFTADGGAATSETSVGKVENAAGAEVDAARADVVATVEDVSVLAGKIKFDKVTTTASVVHDGTRPVISGQTVVSGLTIDGQGYTIDEDGIHAGGETQPDPVLGQINEGTKQALADSGITMTLVSPVDTVEPSEGSRSVGGLMIRMKAERMEDLISALPDPIQNEMRKHVSTGHDTVMIFGAANVRAAALKAFEYSFEEFEPDLGGGDSSLGTEVLGTGYDAGSSSGGGGGEVVSFPGGTAGGTGGGNRVIASQPAFAAPISVDGVSTAAAILGLAVVLAAARGLKTLSDRLLASAGAGGANCPQG